MRAIDKWACAYFLVLCCVCIYMLAPLVLIIVNSFNPSTNGEFPPIGLTLHWYRNALFNVPSFMSGLVNSLIVACISSAMSIVLGTLAAYGLTRFEFPGREMLRTVLLLPMVIPTIVLGAALFLFFVRISIYGSLAGLILGHALLALPFVVTLVSANLLLFGRDYEEAAMDLGAGSFRSFMHVTLPGIREGLVVAALLAFVTSFDQVDLSVFLANPHMTTLPIAMFVYSENFQDPTLAAMSALLLGLTCVLAVIFAGVLKRRAISRLIVRPDAGSPDDHAG
jgi:putative spermidine/putrescine transport system permease protein